LTLATNKNGNDHEHDDGHDNDEENAEEMMPLELQEATGTVLRQL